MRFGPRKSPFHRYRQPEATVCPECGYPVQAPGSPRCSECGTPYPGPWSSRLRWGRRRLPAERRRLHRRFWPIAWLQTFLYATFLPTRAAGRMGVPSETPRVMLMAVAHALIAALLLSVCSTRTVGLVAEYRSTLDTCAAGTPSVWQAVFPAIRSLASETPHVTSWLLCVAAWAFFFLMAVLLGLAVANVVSHRRPAGRSANYRWVLLSTVVFVWIGLASLWISLPANISACSATPTTVPFTPLAALRGPPAPDYPPVASTWLTTGTDWRWLGSDLAPGLWAMIAMHGIWLALGFVGNPHRDRSRADVVVRALGLYAAAWVLCSQLGAWWAHLLLVL